MKIVRIDEVDFRRRQYGVVEDYLTNVKNRAVVDGLKPTECVALVSKNGMNVLFIRGFDVIENANGTRLKALSFYQWQLSRPWSLDMLQHYAKEAKLPFTITNYRSFEELFPSVDKGAEVFVEKSAST